MGHPVESSTTNDGLRGLCLKHGGQGSRSVHARPGEDIERFLLTGFERAWSDEAQETWPGVVAQGKFGSVRCLALISAAKPAHRSRSTPMGLAASGDIIVAKLQPGVLRLDKIGPDRADRLGVLRAISSQITVWLLSTA